MLKCYEIMTSTVQFCEVGTPVNEVAQQMRLMNVGSLPVVDSAESKRVIGIVTDRDLTLSVLARSLDPRIVLVEDVMTRYPVCCDLEDSLEQLLNVMEDNEIRRVPITDGLNRLMGIISESDLPEIIMRELQSA